HLEEGVLEHVLRQGAVGQVAAKIAVQLVLVAAHQARKRLALSAAKAGQEFFVRTDQESVGAFHGSSAGSTQGRGSGFGGSTAWKRLVPVGAIVAGGCEDVNGQLSPR